MAAGRRFFALALSLRGGLLCLLLFPRMRASPMREPLARTL